MAASYDPNTWYSITWPTNNKLLRTTKIYPGSTSGWPWGSAYLDSTSAASGYNYGQWQFTPVGTPNSSQYIIRPGSVNATYALSVSELQIINEGGCGDNCTQPELIVTNTPDASALWTVSPYGDGSTSMLSNQANGTLHAYVRNDGQEGSGSWCFMGGYQSAQNSQMVFEIKSVGQVNDATYSTLPSALAKVASAAPSPTPSSSSSPDSSNGNSDSNTNTKTHTTGSHSSSTTTLSVGAIVGIVLGALVAVITLLVLLLYIRRLRKRANAAPPAHEQQALTTPAGEPAAPSSSYYAAEKVGPGVDAGLAEAPADHAIHEAPRDEETGLGGGATHAASRGEVFEMDAGEGGQDRKGEKTPRWVLR